MNKISTQKGQVIIINTLLFFVLSSAIIFALTSPVISSFKIIKSFSKSKQAFLVANSATNEALYRLNSNMNLNTAETLNLAQGSANIATADTGSGKMITISSDVDSYKRNYEISLSTGEGVSFSYGLQTGHGGFSMINNTVVEGNIYSSGDIIGENNARVTGTAISSNIFDPVSIEFNNGSIPPAYQIDFGVNTNSIPQDIAQSFTVSTTTPISSIRILIKKTGTPSDMTLKIKNNNGSNPGNTTYTQGTISASTVTSSFGYITILLDTVVSLTPGTQYWIVLDNGNNTQTNKYYTVGANDSLYSGNSKKANTGSTWSNLSSPSTRDMYFDIYTSGETGLIQGVTVEQNAWAHEIKNSNVAGTLHCQIGSGNNKVCDTSLVDPVQQPWPISEGNIEEWKNIATFGGATSSISLSGNSVITLDTIKVDGNISLSDDAIIYLDGIIYVTGNITLSNDAQIKASPTLGSSGVIIVSDGRIKTSNSGQFNGSGVSGSYIMVVTTSSCPNGPNCSGLDAITIGNNSGSVILNAQKGTISFSNNATAKQATAYKIDMKNNAVITYEQGLINPNFTSGPSGAWKVNSWKEVE